MIILSFDIGIKNLAFCQLNNDKIIDWNIINISCNDICQYTNNNNIKCDKTATLKNENICLCNTHSKLKNFKDIKFKKIKSNNSIFNIGIKLVDELNKYPQFLECDEVIVENQPSLKNPTMKSVQMILYSYFLINGVKSDNSNITNIEMINARNKLKVYKGPQIECKYKDTYKKNKFLAIKYTELMIKNQEQKFIDLYNNSKKKDDLSDCYLQGIYYLHN